MYGQCKMDYVNMWVIDLWIDTLRVKSSRTLAIISIFY